MAWPTPQEYNEAVQNPRACFIDEQLRTGTVQVNKLGLPRSTTGSFASVYSISCGQERFAVRCFLHNIPDLKLRYERLSKSVCEDDLPQTVDFAYQTEGIRVGNATYPILKMRWVEGETLDVFLRRHHADRSKIQTLQMQFRETIKALAAAGFAHGDLQHGNIIITEQGLQLVDYDGMFVPALSGLPSNELGHRNYQHPGRTREHFGAYLDNFGAWIIDTALTCLIEDPGLFTALHMCDEALMLRSDDFRAPQHSDAFVYLERHDSEIIRSASRKLRTLLMCRIFNVPPLSDDVPEAAEHPRIVEARERAKRAAEVAEQQERERLAREERQRALEQAVRAAKENAERQAAEARARQTGKPDWLDDDTAKVLSAAEAKPVQKAEQAEQAEAPRVAPARPRAQSVYPTADEYADLLRNVSGNLTAALSSAMPFAQGGKPEKPHVFGKTHAVFQLMLESRHLDVALKLYTHEVPDLEERVHSFNAELGTLPSKIRDHLLPMAFISDAIKHKSAVLPATTTAWQTDAQQLDSYLLTGKPDFDYTLLTRYRKLLCAMGEQGISHGNLEPPNFLVKTDGELVLVDYETFYAPGLASLVPMADDLASAYQHPRAGTINYGPEADRFASWLIDTLLLCWSYDREFWRNHRFNRGLLFFHPDDFQRPHQSALLRDLIRHQDYQISSRGRFLLRCLSLDPALIPPLSEDGSVPLEFMN